MSFIVVDGPNGSGKTTLINNLRQDGYNVLSSPGSTAISKILRPMCRGEEPYKDIDPRIQFMLFSAARYDEYLRLVHNKKEIIVADRWWTSTYVYQCILQEFPVKFLEYTIHPQERIDCVILLDANNDTLIKRVMNERALNPKHGLCTWTQDSETIIQLADIYRKELISYLFMKQIKTERIDTTSYTIEKIKNIAETIIKDLCLPF